MQSTPKCGDSPIALRWRQMCQQAAWLYLFALAFAATTAWVHPQSPYRPSTQSTAKPPTITVAEALIWHRNGNVLWVDARPPATYARGHIPDAVPLYEQMWEDQIAAFVARWDPKLTVVVYCDASTCDASDAVARRLHRELQIGRIFVLAGGWEAWQERAP